MTYLTIEDHFKTNGDRHLERAFNHYYHRYPPRYWQRSLDKALKNYKKADSFKLNPLTEAIMKPMLDMIARHMADAVLYGVAYTETENGLVNHIEARDIYDLHS